VALTAAGPLLLGSGNGNFAPGGSHALSGLHIEAADFTGDRKPDLAALNGNELTLQAGNGDGTFGPALSFTLEGRGLALGAGDADGDGAAEILAADDGHAYVINAAGGQALALADRLDLPASRGPFDLELVAPPGAAGSRPSLAVPLADLDQVLVFAARGDGTFDPAGAPLTTGGGPVQIAAADFDGDGRADLASVNDDDTTVSVLAGQQDGTFAAHLDFPAGGAPDGVAAADLNNDNRPDLLVVDPANGSVNVLMNTSPGSIVGPGPEPDPGPGPGPDPQPGPAVLTAAVVGQLPAAVIAGQKARATPVVTVTNEGESRANTAVTVTLFLSPDPTLDPADAQLGAVTKRLRLKPGQGKPVKVKLGPFPAVADGAYHILAQVTEPGGGSAVAAAEATVAVAAPFVDLAGAFASPPLAALKRGEKATVLVNVTNAGNADARGRVEVTLALSADAAAGGDDRVAARVTKKVKLKPGAGKTLKLRLAPPEDLAAGNYYLVTAVDAGNAVAEPDETNNAAASAATFAVE
jgi:hypothetical protein